MMIFMKAALDMLKDNNIDKIYADGAYDNIALYKLLEDNGIEAIIKPRMNARDDSISNIRNENVRCIKQLGYKEWSKYMVRDG
ncbi:MAG: hypothetical protein KatS3mg003_2276 [Candidatus Nitrosocaldaceae archaeon]|nr:MAG: hypothetical protein KatS3mg003_0755 [Candidatus Nitrosocaldaceae archaeon]GIU71280.1 MAG: hypothetical protein KatS3mg003_0759 [Candidatus Nitrosocaldaceae archaeon]GIU71676.1 MAG: hypothetical protein KatS3mg003_1155 [Candidatus Nitrosocaldaceae archaeon]GIU71773.1 MAG: hypothetical protein KatS3mg003_1252 [Candidatus Nitrosocaldaceae archaeon]GIU72028.1 MAG: hypothetical protein KatS3mg003_1507 [Candidatus Nitrosocaldaceae archaeon]